MLVDRIIRPLLALCSLIATMEAKRSPGDFGSLATKAAHQVINTGVSLNQQISSSTLNSSNTVVNGQFVIKHSGRYFLSTDLFAAPARTNVAVLHIAVSDVILDLGGKSITLSTTNNTPSMAAITMAEGVNNITIMNGTINGKGPKATIQKGIISKNNTNLLLDNVRIINCATTSIELEASNSFIMDGVQTYGSLMGASLTNCKIGSINDSYFDGAENSNSLVAGIYADGCHNIEMNQVSTSNNSSENNSAYGLYMLDSTGFTCKNLRAYRNSAGSILCAGIYLKNCDGSVFIDCIANNNTATASGVDVYGFRCADESNGNSFVNCIAKNNLGTSLGTCAGFVVDTSNQNSFKHCVSEGNTSASLVYGFLSTGENIGTVIRECTASGNYTTEDDGQAYGIAFDNETSGAIQNCEISANKGTAVGCGIGLLHTCLRNTVEYNKILGNIGTEQYGFYDHAADNTTFLRGNISFGHGKVFDNTTFIAENTTANYRFTFNESDQQMNPQFLIKEADTANMNAFEASSATWFNFSIIENAISG